VDGKTTDRIVGAIDRNMKQGKISVNGLDHYYFGQLIFVAEGSESRSAVRRALTHF
jgi:hypothetical protein